MKEKRWERIEINNFRWSSKLICYFFRFEFETVDTQFFHVLRWESIVIRSLSTMLMKKNYSPLIATGIIVVGIIPVTSRMKRNSVSHLSHRTTIVNSMMTKRPCCHHRRNVNEHRRRRSLRHQPWFFRNWSRIPNLWPMLERRQKNSLKQQDNCWLILIWIQRRNKLFAPWLRFVDWCNAIVIEEAFAAESALRLFDPLSKTTWDLSISRQQLTLVKDSIHHRRLPLISVWMRSVWRTVPRTLRQHFYHLRCPMPVVRRRRPLLSNSNNRKFLFNEKKARHRRNPKVMKTFWSNRWLNVRWN